MDIQLFDNFDDDGQLSLFGLAEDFEEIQPFGEEAAEVSEAAGESAGETPEESRKRQASEGEAAHKKVQHIDRQDQERDGVGIRIGRCSSCGKMLFVQEENGGYVSACNTCGIRYLQH